MSRKTTTVLLNNGDMILSKMGILTFLGIFLLGLGAGVEVWTASYRAFFVWLVFSLFAGSARVAWKFSDFQRREKDLVKSIERSREEILAKEEEKRKRAEQLESLLTSVATMQDERTADEEQ